MAGGRDQGSGGWEGRAVTAMSGENRLSTHAMITEVLPTPESPAGEQPYTGLQPREDVVMDGSLMRHWQVLHS